MEGHHTSNLWTYLELKMLKVKVARSLDAYDTRWPINREWKLAETSKLIARLPPPRAMTRTSFKVKRSKVKITRQIIALVVDATSLMWNGSTDGTAVGAYRVRDTACSPCKEDRVVMGLLLPAVDRLAQDRSRLRIWEHVWITWADSACRLHQSVHCINWTELVRSTLKKNIAHVNSGLI